MLAKLFYSMIWPTIFKKSIYELFQMENLVIPYLTHLYFANNPKSILHQIPPFYVKQFSVLEYLYIFETHL